MVMKQCQLFRSSKESYVFAANIRKQFIQKVVLPGSFSVDNEPGVN